VLSPLLVAKSKVDLAVLPAITNRHGLIGGSGGRRQGRGAANARRSSDDNAGRLRTRDRQRPERAFCLVDGSLVAGHYEKGKGCAREGALVAAAKSAARAVVSEPARRIVRGALGPILGGSRR
jgi:hypothetical protein